MVVRMRVGMIRGTTTGMIAEMTIDRTNDLQIETRGVTTGTGVGALDEETETTKDRDRGMAIDTIGGIGMAIGAETGDEYDIEMDNGSFSRRLATDSSTKFTLSMLMFREGFIHEFGANPTRKHDNLPIISRSHLSTLRAGCLQHGHEALEHLI